MPRVPIPQFRPLLLACVSVSVLAGCGHHTSTLTLPTSKPRHVAPTSATAVAPVGTADSTSVATAPVPTGTAGTAPAATAQPVPPTSRPVAATSAGPGKVISAAVQPHNVAQGASVRAIVATQGSVARLELYIGSGAPGASSPVTIPLSQTSPGAWAGNGVAPSAPGSYRFTVGLFDASGARRVITYDGWNLLVTGGTGATGGVQPLPADIPLAPPFSYGNPQPAVFTAAGQTVNGSVVTSTTRTDVPPSDVSSFYMIHLPRAGWTIGSGASPGATSFSIYATTAGGKRVVIVEYSLATLHIYYGNLS